MIAMTIDVREATTQADKEALYRFRYHIYVEEQRWSPIHADHALKRLVEPIDAHARNFLATDNGEVIGSIRINLGRDGPLEFEHLYELDKFAPYYPERVSMSTKLAIVPSRRGGAVLKKLLAIPYKLGRELDIQFNFIDCHPHLINLYEYLGYRRYTSNINHPEAGYMTPMVLVVEDLAHLESVGSPLAAVARNLKNNSAAAEMFSERFPQYSVQTVERLRSSDEFWISVSERLSGKSEDVPLFRHMSDNEIRAVVACGNLIDARAGDRIVGMGEHRRELYTLISGKAEARLEVQGAIVRLNSFERGDTFGEMAFLAGLARSADVVALEDCEVLVHPADRLGTLVDARPELACKFYQNLARLISLRLSRTTALLR